MIVCAAGGLPGELHKLWRSPRRGDYHLEYGYSCMGYEIPGGLGVKMARPDAEIVVILGDGSYMMMNSELATSVTLGLKLIVVVLDNRGFGCIDRLQRATGGASFNNLLDTARRQALSVIDAAEAAKPIFCEKPIALDLDRARRSVAVADRYRTPLMIGFDRRLDPSFRRLSEALEAGEIGDVELVRITSRDPAPPSIVFVERSDGLFHDMMIHDFDTARSLIGEEIVDVTAMGSVLIDQAIGEAGDVDTGAVMLRSSSGRLALISNSRRATYGYDQRIEVHGAGGMMSAGNPVATTITRAGGTGFATDPLGNFFMDRYADAFRYQMEAFCAVVGGQDVTYPNGADGLAALAIADAAAQSLRTGRTVAVPDQRSLP